MMPSIRFAAIILALATLLVGSASVRAQTSPWDDATSGAILAAIQNNRALSGSTITVDCYAGTVMLTGIVSTYQLRDPVEQTVRQIPGVTRIIDELNQDAERTAADAQHDAAIQSALDMTLARYTTSPTSVVVARGHAYDGIVYLLGSVSDSNMNDILQSSVMALPGVHAVVAHVTIQQQPASVAASVPPRETPPPIPPSDAIAALPKALVAAHKRPRVIDRRAEDETAERITRSAAASAPGRDYSVQLASEFDEAAALSVWKRRKAANDDLLGPLTPSVTRVDLGAKGIRFRLKAGPLPDQAAAQQLCAQLAERHVTCLVVRNAVASEATTAAALPVASPPDLPASEARQHPANKHVRKQPIAPGSMGQASDVGKSAPKSAPVSPSAGRNFAYYVQLASRTTEAAARDYWAKQHLAHGDILGGLSPVVTAADLGERGTMYRLKAGPVSDRTAASALCSRLAKYQLDCLVVRDSAARPAP